MPPPHSSSRIQNTQKSLRGIRLTIYFTKQTPSGLPTLTRKRQTTRRWDHLPEGFPSYYKGFPGVMRRARGVTERSQHYWSAPPADSVRRQWNSRHVSPFYSFVTLNLSFSLRAKKRKCRCRARKPLHQPPMRPIRLPAASALLQSQRTFVSRQLMSWCGRLMCWSAGKGASFSASHNLIPVLGVTFCFRIDFLFKQYSILKILSKNWYSVDQQAIYGMKREHCLCRKVSKFECYSKPITTTNNITFYSSSQLSKITSHW